MQTQLPHDPPVPHGVYPTAPPWAAPPPPSPVESAAQASWTGHSRLLVPYPEEMYNAARPQPPSWWPVALFTLLFGPLGAISARRRARTARLARNDRHPYWIAFGTVLALNLVVGFAVTLAR